MQQSRLFIRDPDITHSGEGDQMYLNCRNLWLLVGMYTKHCLLKRHLHVIDLSEDNVCRGCAKHEGTPFYILCYSLVFADIRNLHLSFQYLKHKLSIKLQQTRYWASLEARAAVVVLFREIAHNEHRHWCAARLSGLLLRKKKNTKLLERFIVY